MLTTAIAGKSKFIQDEVVGVADAVDKWSGKGEVVPGPQPDPGDVGHRLDSYDLGDSINRAYWSETYQWLPANLAFQEDGTVRFTSYINNLHPKKHPEVYRLVEKLVDTAIPAWNRVLSSTPVDGDGKTQKRFALPDPVEWVSHDTQRFGHPVCWLTQSAYLRWDEKDTPWEEFNPEILAAHETEHGPVKYDEDWLAYLSDDEVEANMPDDEEDNGSQPGPRTARKIQRLKWREISEALFPEPLDFKPFAYRVGKSLRERFKDTGLQVIVKMASIELTPEKPEFPAGGWHVSRSPRPVIYSRALT
jgi:hypothetical protein